MFRHIRSTLCTAALLLSPAVASAQVYLPASAPPVPGSALANTSQVYYYSSGVPYYQGFYYPGPQGYYPGPLEDQFRTPLGFDIPSMIVIAPSAGSAVPAGTTTAATVMPTITAAAPTENAVLWPAAKVLLQ
jgi:hypothetical protein